MSQERLAADNSADENTAPGGAETPEPGNDRALIEAVRAGDTTAYAELWRRHASAGVRFARSLRSAFDAEDLTAEAFARILTALRSGRGPAGAFRPYLYATVRNTAYTWQRSNVTVPLADAADQIPDERSERALSALDGSPIVSAFRALPPSWQEVLWYVEVEELEAAAVAPLLGISPNAVAARTYRAREGLRQAWVQAQIDTVSAGSAHRWALEHVGAYVLDGLSQRQRKRVQKHFDTCPRCATTVREARQISSRLALSLVPAATVLTGAGLTVWLRGFRHPTAERTVDASDPPGNRTRHKHYLPAAVVVVAVGLLLVGDVAGRGASPQTTLLTQPTPSQSAPAHVAPRSAPATAPNSKAGPVRHSAPRMTAVPVVPSHPKPSASESPAGVVMLALPQVLIPIDGIITNTTRLTVTGIATPASSITVSSAGTAIGTGTVGGDGTWSLTADVSVLNGPSQLTVTSTLEGAQPTASTMIVVFDRHIAIPSGITVTNSDTGTVISGRADPDAVVHVQGDRVDAFVTASTAGTWSTVPLTGLPTGYGTVTATASDVAGNVSPPSAPIPVQITE